MAEIADIYGSRIRSEPVLAPRRSYSQEQAEVMKAIEDKSEAAKQETIDKANNERKAARFALCAEIAVAVCSDAGIGDGLASRHPDMQSDLAITRVMNSDEIELAERLVSRLDIILAIENNFQSDYSRSIAANSGVY